MLTLRRSLLAVTFLSSLLGLATANALSFDTLTEPFTGTDSAVLVTLSEEGGDIRVTATVTLGIADLRAVYLNIGDNSLLSGLSVTGDDVTDYEFAAHGVIDMGQGANLNGGGTPCPCDIGVEIGTPGIGKDDFQTTTFLLHGLTPLSLSDFTDQLVGVRITSVGPDADSRGGSAKLVGTFTDTVPVPEPSPAILTAMGLSVLAVASRRLRS